MSVIEWVTLGVLVLVALGWYLTYTAARMDRLHTRVEGSFAALDAQLVRRAEACVELANSGALDPASALIVASAASDALDSAVGSLEDGLGRHGDRGAIESALSEAVNLVLTEDLRERLDPSSAALVQRVVDASTRVQLARRFHNDAVRDALRLRAQPMVHVFRLAGRTELPETVEFDDTVVAS